MNPCRIGFSRPGKVSVISKQLPHCHLNMRYRPYTLGTIRNFKRVARYAHSPLKIPLAAEDLCAIAERQCAREIVSGIHRIGASLRKSPQRSIEVTNLL